MPLIGIIDLVAEVEERPTVVDFKTASSAYGANEAALSDQLTAYELAKPEAEEAALCVLVKTKTPKIEWHVSRRTDADLLEFLEKAELVADAIEEGRFYKRPGLWCSWCDFLPVCLGDGRRLSRT